MPFCLKSFTHHFLMSELLTSIVLLLTVPGSLGLREVRVRPQGIWLNVGDGRWLCIRLWSLLGWVLLLVYHIYTHTHRVYIHCIYTMNYYSAIKRNEIMLFAVTWKDLEITVQMK